MKYTIYYDRTTQSWWAYWTDSQDNQLGDAVFAHNKEECLIELGQVKDSRRKLMQDA